MQGDFQFSTFHSVGRHNYRQEHPITSDEAREIVKWLDDSSLVFTQSLELSCGLRVFFTPSHKEIYLFKTIPHGIRDFSSEHSMSDMKLLRAKLVKLVNKPLQSQIELLKKKLLV